MEPTATTFSDCADRLGAAVDVLSYDVRIIPKAIAYLANLIDTAVRLNEAEFDAGHEERPEGTEMTRAFQGDRPFGRVETVRGVLERVDVALRYEPQCYVVAAIYLHRFIKRQPRCRVALDASTAHRLALAAVLAAAKFVSNRTKHDLRNSEFAKHAGIETAEMNKMEMQFVWGLGFNLFVATEEFESFCRFLHSLR